MGLTRSDVESGSLICYRAGGLGVYGAIMRWAGMPLEKIALFMNSSQVSGSNQLSQAVKLTFADGWGAPFRVVGRASLVAWFLQYSVMGFIFQTVDASLSSALGVRRVVYGEELMMSNEERQAAAAKASSGAPQPIMSVAAKTILAPVLSGTIESVVANRAEVQRYYGITKFSQIEAKLGWGAFSRYCGPAFMANAARNIVMSSTSFIVTPILFANYYPQEKKSKQSLFWFAMGMNIFAGNTVAITQQALWGRALDYAAKDGGRAINYREVVRHGLATEGVGAFYTVPKWFARVLMNAPAQGSLPWFYNQVLPVGQPAVLGAVASACSAVGIPDA
jgi:hypothetical protein